MYRVRGATSAQGNQTRTAHAPKTLPRHRGHSPTGTHHASASIIGLSPTTKACTNVYNQIRSNAKGFTVEHWCTADVKVCCIVPIATRFTARSTCICWSMSKVLLGPLRLPLDLPGKDEDWHKSPALRRSIHNLPWHALQSRSSYSFKVRLHSAQYLANLNVPKFAEEVQPMAPNASKSQATEAESEAMGQPLKTLCFEPRLE
eukprot:CAMPEP_0115265574 /NCGR_PEP_ID=MMETSP0270-20121206/51019_1 /TAXON_ID=71861 /ORGANISM="Scrippsiella trochoidea, Strain CCMP3099" /LENGTH=202 /DNA_ID=CAMNT_0002681637 /DNA_START=122 /DNA_END=726 /DNA_ORIENTATION=-